MSGTLTPMMKQYLKIHETVPDTILFYRLGDFYEMFFDDAKTASKVLDLTLTGKNCGLSQRAPMCGVPYHSANNYISKLIEKGFKVAICEQVGDVKESKGIVDREITRIISPGTVMEGKALSEGENNYLMGIYYNKVDFGVCYTDISTGEFNVCNISGVNRINELETLISKVMPSQIIVNTILFEDKIMRERISNLLNFEVEPYPSGYFALKNAKALIKEQFDVYSLNSLGIEEYEAVIKISGCILRYLNETQKKSLMQITKLNLDTKNDVMHLDNNTKRNLELLYNLKTKEKKDSLLSVLDQTVTAMGARKLKKWILEPLTNKDEIVKRQDAIEALLSDIMSLEDIITFLKDVKDMERIMARLSLDIGNARDLVSLKNSLYNIPKIKISMSYVMEKSELLKSIVLDIDELGDIYDLIETSIDEDCPAVLKNGGLIKKGYDPKIDELKKLRDNSNEILLQLENREREKTGIKTLKIKYNKVFGYFFDVTNSFKDKVPDYFIRKQTLANSERFFTDELKDLEINLLTVDDKLKEKEFEEYERIKSEVLDNVRRVQSCADLLSLLDCLCSLAIVSRINSYVRPEIAENGVIDIKDGRYPVIEKITGSDKFIYNDTYIDDEDNRMIIITGANMAGKSTYIRQVALIVIMAQIGSFVPASKAKIPICDRVFTRVGASDDLASGQSTFMVEMSEVTNILKYATKNSLVILDEVGRGTSTFDGLSIAHAVIEYLLSDIGAKTLFATHYHELTALEEEKKGVKNYSIRLENKMGKIIFLRKVERGGIDKSYGIEVAKLAGLPDKVIRRSEEILSVLEKNEMEYKMKVDNIQTSIPLSFEKEEEDVVSQNVKNILMDITTSPIEEMTPVEAMNYLNEIKQRLKAEDF